VETKAETTTQVTQVLIKAPIQKVWDTLVKQDEVLPFFFGNVMHTTRFEPGAPIRMRSPNGKYTGVVGDVLEVDEPNLYSMTFKFTNYDDAVCRITHELVEVDGGTQYTLVAEGVPVDTKTAKSMAGGGKIIANTLKSCVERGKPTATGTMIMIMGKLFGFLTPKVSLSENWPMETKTPLPPGVAEAREPRS